MRKDLSKRESLYVEEAPVSNDVGRVLRKAWIALGSVT